MPMYAGGSPNFDEATGTYRTVVSQSMLPSKPRVTTPTAQPQQQLNAQVDPNNPLGSISGVLGDIKSGLNRQPSSPTNLQGISETINSPNSAGNLSDLQSRLGAISNGPVTLQSILDAVQGLQPGQSKYQTPEQLQGLVGTMMQVLQPYIAQQQNDIRNLYGQKEAQANNVMETTGMLNSGIRLDQLRQLTGQEANDLSGATTNALQQAIPAAFNYANLGLQEDTQNQAAQQAVVNGLMSTYGLGQQDAERQAGQLVQLYQLGQQDHQALVGNLMQLYGLSQQDAQNYAQNLMQWGALNLNVAQVGEQSRQFNADLAERQRQFNDSLGLQNRQLGLDTQRLGESVRQFDVGNQTDIGRLLGVINGQPTLDSKQLDVQRLQSDRNYSIQQAQNSISQQTLNLNKELKDLGVQSDQYKSITDNYNTLNAVALEVFKARVATTVNGYPLPSFSDVQQEVMRNADDYLEMKRLEDAQKSGGDAPKASGAQ